MSENFLYYGVEGVFTRLEFASSCHLRPGNSSFSLGWAYRHNFNIPQKGRTSHVNRSAITNALGALCLVTAAAAQSPVAIGVAMDGPKDMRDRVRQLLVPEVMALDIVHEDEHLLVLNKPPGKRWAGC